MAVAPLPGFTAADAVVVCVAVEPLAEEIVEFGAFDSSGAFVVAVKEDGAGPTLSSLPHAPSPNSPPARSTAAPRLRSIMRWSLPTKTGACDD